MKNRTSRNSGFTLVEIMIVVAIIGLLAAIAIPNFVRARTQSQKNACINNLRQIDGAVQQWALETKAASTATVGGADVLPYLHSSVLCPSGGTEALGFADSYVLTTVAAKPTCKRNTADTTMGHILPVDTTAAP
jgi:prepilin-type N-terminal cleavage/methylation domain-containing protein